MKADVLFVEFPGQFQTQPFACDWIRRSMSKARADARFGRVVHTRLFGTPIPMLRNKALKSALREKFDYVVMIDSDMEPDHNHPGENSDKPFWESSWDFIFTKHLGVPCLIMAPYCGPPPHENVFVFRWRNQQSKHPNVDHQLEAFTREEAAIMGGISRIAAGPTGVIIIDTRGLKYLPLPWFYYGYQDEYEAEKVMTEDVAFTRNWGLTPAKEFECFKGMPLYCNWDSWAVHWKPKGVGKPEMLTSDQVFDRYAEVVKSGFRSDERLLFFGETPYDEAVVYKHPDELAVTGHDSPVDPRDQCETVPPTVIGEYSKSECAHLGTKLSVAPKLNKKQVSEMLPFQPVHEDEASMHQPRKTLFRPTEFPCDDPLSVELKPLQDGSPSTNLH